MPIATPEVYAEMLDRAKAGAFAYPAINVTSSQTLNAALRGFAEAGSDGIVQVSTGGAEYLSGPTVKDMVAGAVALAEYAHEVATQVRRPRSRCTPTTAPRTSSTASSVRCSRSPRSGSARGGTAAVPVAHVGRLGGAAGGEPADRRGTARRSRQAANIVLEIEVGVVGGEEDGVVARDQREALHDTPRTALPPPSALGTGREGPLHRRR